MSNDAAVNRSRPWLTLAEAVQATGVSHSTMKRRLRADAFPDATQDSNGAWIIPVDNLLAAGLRVNAPTGTAATSSPEPTAAPDPRDARIAELEAQLAAARQAAQMAQELAAERLDRVGDIRLALRALEAGNGPRLTTQGQPEMVWVRGWFGRPRLVPVLDAAPRAAALGTGPPAGS